MPTWIPIEEKAAYYGVCVDTPTQLYKFILTLNNNNNWYSQLQIDDRSICISLMDARTYAGSPSLSEKQMLINFQQLLKNGQSRSYFDMFNNEAKVSEALSKADTILYRNKELGVKTTYYTASTYPIELAKIDNPPAIIYYKGAEFNEISDKTIACVGTRKPTRLSYNAANYLIPQWVKEDCSIISGLACGVDKISHQACITAGGKTIAVLAHEFKHTY